jgi:hypothetical protein
LDEKQWFRGCWDAWTGGLDEMEDRKTFSGCINVLDLLS